jgi:pimeloyl-ACP methyl ester carboxylesterase
MDAPVSSDGQTATAPAREMVVLVHGFAAPSWVMSSLATRLREAGFGTELWTYTTYRGRLREHSDRLAEVLTRLAASAETDKIHVVAHSMGTIVARGAIRMAKLEKLGRVVLMAPPNRGTTWSRWLEPIVKRLIPTVYDLSSSPTSYVNQLPTPDRWFVGIIRADFDLLVPRWSVELSEQMDFISFPTLHSMLLFRRDVADAVCEFLRTGAFPMPPQMAND